MTPVVSNNTLGRYVESLLSRAQRQAHHFERELIDLEPWTGSRAQQLTSLLRWLGRTQRETRRRAGHPRLDRPITGRAEVAQGQVQDGAQHANLIKAKKIKP